MTVLLILMCERMNLIQKFVVYKDNSHSEHFNFFVFNINVSHKILSAPWLLNFQEFSNTPTTIKFSRIF